MSWAAQTEWMNESEFARFQKELASDPSKPVSHGTGELLALLGGLGRPARPAPKKAKGE